MAFAEHFDVIGFDINQGRINELNGGHDRTGETTEHALDALPRLTLTKTLADLAACSFYIITVPTPVDASNHPDFSPLIAASHSVASLLTRGDIVVYESTVFPGATEEICVPILQSSGLVYNQEFFVGYSPERINPGDKARGLADIVKVTSGSTAEAAQAIDATYAKVVTAGTYLAPSIAVAEASKVIENVQRDVNIALMNELATLFGELDLDTLDVLSAAETKWNFMPFRPGLVGGHCIGVDPYYLIRKAQSVGHNPELIRASRRINNAMGGHIANRVIRLMIEHDVPVNAARILILGLTFKEDCPDLRNSRVIDVIRELQALGMQVDVYDPWANPEESSTLYDLSLLQEPAPDSYDAIVLTVKHELFREAGSAKIRCWGKTKHVLFDTKCALPGEEVDGRL